jgi:hypothetical protein
MTATGSVIHQDVYTPKLGLCKSNDAGYVFILGQVTYRYNGIATRYLNFLSNPLGLTFTPSVDDDRGSFLGEAFGYSLADAAGASGH